MQAEKTVNAYSYRLADYGRGRVWIGVFWGAEVAGGIVFAPSSEPGIWDVQRLGVDWRHRRQGLARELHRRAHAHAAEQGGLLRVLQTPNPKFAAVWERLRAQRVALEGGAENAPGKSALDPERRGTSNVQEHQPANR